MNEVAIRNQEGGLSIPSELSVEDVVAQVQKIQKLMGAVMHEGEHYGKLPGTEKPSLYQPGAQKLNFVFRLGDRNTKIEQVDLPHGHREYRVTLDIVHIPSGMILAQGVGSCSTREAKYRWRKQYTEEQVGSVPKEYWKASKDDFKARQDILANMFGAGSYRTRKVSGQWVVLRIEGDGERIENPDIADTYNTVLKMAHKRAYVYGTIKATAASDLFTQDLEDFAEGGGDQKSETKEGKQDKDEGEKQDSGKPPAQSKDDEKQEKAPKGKIKDPIRQDLINEIADVLNNAVFNDAERAAAHHHIKHELATHQDLVDYRDQLIAEAERRMNKPKEPDAPDPDFPSKGRKPESSGKEGGFVGRGATDSKPDETVKSKEELKGRIDKIRKGREGGQEELEIW